MKRKDIEYVKALYAGKLASEISEMGMPYSYQAIRAILWDAMMWGERVKNEHKKQSKNEIQN